MKKIIALVLLLAAATCLFAAKEKEVAKVNKVMPFTKGLNLSGWLEDLGRGNSRSLMFNRQDFEDIKSLGVEVIRIPIYFEEFSSGEPDYIIEDWLWEKIDNAVEWCTELKMYMLIDFHNNTASTGAGTKTKPDVEDMLVKIWKQIAEHYKDSGEYVLYEIMNEPHMKSGNIAADVAKWGKLQGNVLKEIRKIDKTHTVIVCAEDYCSVKYLLKLPDYKDDNLIYNFHDYTPMLFTHQGASWVGLENVRHVPFPYSKEKMPEKPKNQEKQDWIDWMFENYRTEGSEAYLVKPLDEAVKFANKRGVALMCNEYGVVMDYADNAERCNWYRLKAKWMEERNICRVSWDYKDKNGIFTNDSQDARFPEDLNTDLLEAMGFNVPQEKTRDHTSWFKNAQKTGDYTIYKNGFVKGILPGGWNITKFRINKKDSDAEPAYINAPKATAYACVQCLFGEECDFSSLVSNGKSLEFEVCSNQKNLNLSVYFMNKEIKGSGKANYPWRCQTIINDKLVPADGKWHKVSIPLKDFYDAGAWSDYENKWFNPEGLFSWSKVYELRFDFGERGLQNKVSIRNIAIR